MPLTVLSVITFIPSQILQYVKNLLKNDGISVYDFPFRLSTKYTPCLLLIMMSLSFGNQFLRNIEIDCPSTIKDPFALGGGGDSSSSRNTYGGSGDDKHATEMNDYCWNHGTFLVVDGLKPENRRMAPYPGIIRHFRGESEIIKQNYYKYVWLIIAALITVSYGPHFLWKLGQGKITNLVQVIPEGDATETEAQVSYYLETIGFNFWYAYRYLGCKILATGSPAFQLFLASAALSDLFRTYGYDVAKNFFNETDPWPDPMDVLFPKMAKCEWTRHGFSGDTEYKTAICQLPMNNLTQWTFLVYWWWLGLVFVVNVLSLLTFLFVNCTPIHRIHLRRIVRIVCDDDFEKMRVFSCGKKNALIKIKLSFSDLVVLNFVAMNLEDWQFRNLIKSMVHTKNKVFYLKIKDKPKKNRNKSQQPNGNGRKWYQLYTPGIGPHAKAANLEIGFKQSIINGTGSCSGTLPKAYIANETGGPPSASTSFACSSSCDKNYPPISGNEQEEDWLAGGGGDADPCPDTDTDPPPEYPTINSPVPIHRSCSTKTKPTTKGQGQGQKKSSATPKPSAPPANTQNSWGNNDDDGW